MSSEIEVWDGRQVTAARALAGLTIIELALKATTTKRVISDIEVGGLIRVSPNRRHGHVSADVWDRIVDALRNAGVELLPESGTHGSGARWILPRRKRS